TAILALRSVVEGLPAGFPPVRAANPSALGDALPDLDGAAVVLVRLLGGRRAWEGGFDELRRRCLAAGVPLLAFGGEAVPDAELAALSTVPAATVAHAFEYLSRGGLANIEHLLRFVVDTVLMGGLGFDPPTDVPATGVLETGLTHHPDRPTVAVVFYRAHLLSGNTQFVQDLATALAARDVNPLPVWCYSLRTDGDGRIPALEPLPNRRVDRFLTKV